MDWNHCDRKTDEMEVEEREKRRGWKVGVAGRGEGRICDLDASLILAMSRDIHSWRLSLPVVYSATDLKP